MELLKLKEPFAPEAISWRVGSTTADKKSGLALAYIDARDVMDRLDKVCGPENWKDEYPNLGSTTVCCISIKIGDEWVYKTDGAGSTDVEAEKGQLSDAFKRCAVKWGVGRYLYDDKYKSIWVEIEAYGRSYRIKKTELARLGKMFGVKSPIAKWADTTPPNTVVEQKPEDLLTIRAKAFSDYLDKLQSSTAVGNLVVKNNALLWELKEAQPELYESINKQISQIQEAFQLSEDAE